MDAKGEPMGIRFGPQQLMSNSGLSLQGGEFAREQGRYHEYHMAVFKAFFTDCKDIGDRRVLGDVAQGVGLDVEGFNAALDAGTYRHILEKTRADAKKYEVKAAPTFFIGHGPVTGAQPLETFRSILAGLAGE